MKSIIHGEVILLGIKALPEGLKEVQVKDNFYVVGESETHGNDHRVAVKNKLKVRFYEDEKGQLFMVNETETEIYCPKEGRHDRVVVAPGIRKIKKAMEFDHVKKQLRQVRD